MLACRWRWSSASTSRRSASMSIRSAWRSCARVTTPPSRYRPRSCAPPSGSPSPPTSRSCAVVGCSSLPCRLRSMATSARISHRSCVPILERMSGLKFNRDFFAGYSPERINPGDKEHRLTTIRKVTSGSTPEVADSVDRLYAAVVTAGTHRASSIRVAEAAKVIENTQRDVNIALINELALIFNRLGIDTEEVLKAAGSKWNFLPFRPGLVGGHCIGVDPYYLTHKAQEIGYHPEMILAGRRLNDNMALHVANEIVKLMTRKRIHVNGAKALVLGITFKENCPDIRNSKVVDVVRELQKFGAQVDIYDPWAEANECKHEYGFRLTRSLERNGY